jgi:hypothetical protein
MDEKEIQKLQEEASQPTVQDRLESEIEELKEKLYRKQLELIKSK